MFATTFSYDFAFKDGKRATGASLWTKPGKEKEQPRFPNTRIECDLDHVDTIVLSHGGTSKVFWDKHVFGDKGNPLILFESPRDLALIVTCEGQVVIARSDPTANRRIGLAVYNEDNKVLLVGIGDLVELKEPLHTHQLVADFRPAYEHMAWSPKAAAHLTGSVRKDKTGGDRSAGSGPDGGTPDGGP